MSDIPESNPNQPAAFAKLWSDSCARLMQAAMAYSPETTPPELLKQIRGGLMQALTQSWEEFLRSPQFLDGMKQMMEQAVAFRKFSAEVLTKSRHATEGVAHDDVESLRAVLGQMESRLSRQIDDLAAQTAKLAKGPERATKRAGRRNPAPSDGPPAAKTPPRRRKRQQ